MEAIQVNKIKMDGIVIDSLELVRMIFDEKFTKHHLNLILTLLSLYNENKGAMVYKIPIKELYKIYSPKNPRVKNIKEDTCKTAKELMQLYFIVPNKTKGTLKYHHWVDTVEIPANPSDSDYMEITLHKDVEQFFGQLHKLKLVYQLKYILELSTLTEAKLYRWAYAKKGFHNAVPISIDDAKMLFCGKTDINTSDFIRYNLASAIKHINEKTDLNIEFEKVCSDKQYKHKVTSLKFKIDCSYEKKPVKKRSESQIKHDKERGKQMWQEMKKLKEENEFLSKRNHELESKEIVREQQLELETNKPSFAII